MNVADRRRAGKGPGADVLTAYLNQIGHFSLLSAGEEVDLATASRFHVGEIP